MSGPEHYQQAEELLNFLEGKDRETYPGQESIIAEAQVHAILALAAATALGTRSAEERQWLRVARADPD
jgi:hypothetical protein